MIILPVTLFEVLLIKEIRWFPQSNLVKWSNIEAFTFFLPTQSLLNVEIVKEYYYFHGNILVYMNSMGSVLFFFFLVSSCGFISQELVWNGTSERDKPGLWVSARSFKP